MSVTMNRRAFLAGVVMTGAATGLPAANAAPARRDPFGMAGVYTALFTPFTKDNRVNEEMIARTVAYGIRNGIRGFYLTGGTGEGLLLSKEERKTVYRAAV
jgi:hypothetical protein